jgi:hypothetical protein
LVKYSVGRRLSRSVDLADSVFRLTGTFSIIAIIAALIALHLPAVQPPREATRRAQCINDMKQPGLALANYETAVGAYPVACGAHGVDGGTIVGATDWVPWGG